MVVKRLLSLLALALLVGCGGGEERDAAGDSPSSSTSATATSTHAEEPSPTALHSVRLFFENAGCRGDAPVERTVSQSPDPAAALTALFAGPTKEESGRGLGFVTKSNQLLRRVHIDDGTAYVDLDESFLAVNNVSTSCAGQIFLGGVERTLKQFPGVQRVRYAVAADPAAFYEFMQYPCPEPCDPSPFKHRV
jgi:spore germination protein GerM